jgi:hypothetical protein
MEPSFETTGIAFHPVVIAAPVRMEARFAFASCQVPKQMVDVVLTTQLKSHLHTPDLPGSSMLLLTIRFCRSPDADTDVLYTALTAI